MDEKLAVTPLGRVSVVPRGAYDPDAAYERLDLVQYEGSGYIALKDATGIAPADGESWMLLASAGSGGGGSGPPGQDGKSAYEAAQDGGYMGSETQFNEDLAGVHEKASKTYVDEAVRQAISDSWNGSY